jgi:rhamnogalacturonyl hydrolase YesR
MLRTLPQASDGQFPETTSIKQSCERVLAYAEAQDYIGYGKFDALNSPFLKAASLNNKWLRLIASQVIKQSPVNLRPLFGVRRFKNPKGMGLFARAYLNLYRTYGEEHYLHRANDCLSWLAENAAQGYAGYCWGYNWDWQDLGFLARFGSPNCVVTAFVGQALLDAYECTGDKSYLAMAASCLNFVRHDLKVLYEDEAMKCVSYVPSNDIRMVVMDVSALAGALMARVYHHTDEKGLATEARKLVNYVVDKQTDYGAWFYTHPPGDSPVKHDNYHTGFILDAILDYELATGDDSFRSAYQRGLNFYTENLFLPNGAPKWMSHKTYPFDIHGAATGIGTFSRAACYGDKSYIDHARRVANWAIENMQAPAGYFYYQKGRFWAKKYTLMRWCNAGMAYGLSSLLLTEDKLARISGSPIGDMKEK